MKDIVDVPYILFFDADEEELVKRIMHRAETSGRVDDNVETLKKRLATFREQSMPIIKMFESQGKCKRIDGTQSIDEVFSQVKENIKDLI